MDLQNTNSNFNTAADSTTPLTPTLQVKPPELAPESEAKGQPKNRFKRNVLFIALAALIFIGSLGGAYTLGRNSKKPQIITNQTAYKTLNLPPEAIVTVECEPGRGKQYIIPKDIPKGPIYDVNNNRVIAIEYLVTIQDLLTKPDSLTDKITELTKNYQVDHFNLVPTAPHAGENTQHVHLIMFIVSKSEAATITCGNTPTDSSTEDMTHMH